MFLRTFGRVNCRKFSSAPISFQLQFCIDSVKRSDYENFLATLLLPTKDGCRDSVFALRAFNIELAKIPDSSSNPLVAKVKFQFWTETLEKIYTGAKVPAQPVAIALSEAVRRKKLTKKWLSGLIDKRLAMLDRRGFATIAELENYSNATVSQLLYSTLECLDIRDVQADHVASHIGKSVGLVNHIRSIPFHAAKERVLIPNDLLILHKVSQQEILRGTTSGEHSGLKSVVFDLAAQANSHLLSARKGNGTVKNEAKVAFLAAVAVDQFLQRLQLVDFNIFHKRMASGSGLLPLKMWWYKMRKLY